MQSVIRFCGDKNLSTSKARPGKRRKRFSLIEGESIGTGNLIAEIQEQIDVRLGNIVVSGFGIKRFSVGLKPTPSDPARGTVS